MSTDDKTRLEELRRWAQDRADRKREKRDKEEELRRLERQNGSTDHVAMYMLFIAAVLSLVLLAWTGSTKNTFSSECVPNSEHFWEWQTPHADGCWLSRRIFVSLVVVVPFLWWMGFGILCGCQC